MNSDTNLFERMPRPAVIAHRGASIEAPENTLASLRLAVDMGADAIELDAKLSADGEVVVIHDHTVGRTTDGHGRVKDLRIVDLKKLDAGVNHNGKYRGERIPTLAEVFEAVGEQTVINVELTNYVSPFDDLPLRVIDLIRRYHLEDRIFLSSFNLFALLRTRHADPHIPRALLVIPGSAAFWMRAWMMIAGLGCQAIHPHLGDVDPGFIHRMHANDLRVHVYTVNEPADISRMVSFDVDGIFTDDVRTAKEIVSAGIEK